MSSVNQQSHTVSQDLFKWGLHWDIWLNPKTSVCLASSGRKTRAHDENPCMHGGNNESPQQWIQLHFCCGNFLHCHHLAREKKIMNAIAAGPHQISISPAADTRSRELTVCIEWWLPRHRHPTTTSLMAHVTNNVGSAAT